MAGWPPKLPMAAGIFGDGQAHKAGQNLQNEGLITEFFLKSQYVGLPRLEDLSKNLSILIGIFHRAAIFSDLKNSGRCGRGHGLAPFRKLAKTKSLHGAPYIGV